MEQNCVERKQVEEYQVGTVISWYSRACLEQIPVKYCRAELQQEFGITVPISSIYFCSLCSSCLCCLEQHSCWRRLNTVYVCVCACSETKQWQSIFLQLPHFLLLAGAGQCKPRHTHTQKHTHITPEYMEGTDQIGRSLFCFMTSERTRVCVPKCICFRLQNCKKIMCCLFTALSHTEGMWNRFVTPLRASESM